MSNKGQTRQIPLLTSLPRPLYARSESWGQEGSVTPWHQHAWGQLTYAVTGVLSVNTKQGCYMAPPQFAVWVPGNMQHQVVAQGAAEMRGLYIQTEVLHDQRWQHAFVCEITPLCRELIVRFCQQPIDYKPDTPQSRLVDTLVDELTVQRDAHIQLPLPMDKRTHSICQYLQTHPYSQESITDLGQKVGLTGRSISRLFKTETGLTFQQWRQRLRLLHALTRLEKGDNVMKVALECGYDSNSAFVAAFKKQFGQTPGRYFQTKSQL
ncbi:AraC family transcriptional regulator [Thaumasiovibrio subtropicus]|uniref:AraC family transcriptional regulator n=1 Tax=Thaumasiovibrio subtropicus TaxID=1891207 RepID=UPI000B356922|nr:helix-turn-helix transcriptional regulator [Thaumasiovibrio subtropicus]